MDKKNLCDLDVAGQKVLVRVDYNVPMDETGKITDDTRIRASLETIKYLLEHKAAVILMAHLGRPKGQVNIKYSLAPVAKHLAKLLNMPVAFAGDCIGEEAEKAIKSVEAIAAKTYVTNTTTTVTENRIEFMPLETTDGVQKLYDHLSKQAEKLGLPVPGALYVGGSADSAWTAMVGAPTLCGMGPQAVGAHSNNEYLFVPSMTERAQLLAMCIMHLDEMQ